MKLKSNAGSISRNLLEFLLSDNTSAANNKPNRHLQQLCETLELGKFKDKITLKREKRKRQKERRRKLKKNLQNTSSTTDQGPKMVQTLASKNSVKASIPKVVIFKGIF